jgi:hypothetical protein
MTSCLASLLSLSSWRLERRYDGVICLDHIQRVPISMSYPN